MSYAGLGLHRLPIDTERCQGNGCGVKAECLRYVALATMGPRTPVNGTSCANVEEREAFILAARPVTA